MDRATVAAFVERARDSDTWLCADECYVDLYEGSAPASVLEFAGPGSPGVLSFLSLSKRSGMTGYRSGAVVGDPVAIARLAALRVATGTASPEFVQAAAIAAGASLVLRFDDSTRELGLDEFYHDYQVNDLRPGTIALYRALIDGHLSAKDLPRNQPARRWSRLLLGSRGTGLGPGLPAA